jgi:3-deoxy-manno-octulosonate cytidylyltransferase (CMP-KDO synthetase)
MGDFSPAAVTVIIPARMASERFPGKVLAGDTGWPLIRHVWERVRKATSPQRIVIATDDQRVAAAAAGFGAECVMTSSDCANGTMRVAEAARRLDLPPDDIVVNVQGDEPELEPDLIDRAAAALGLTGASMATIAAPMGDDEDAADPNIVKVAGAEPHDGVAMALYFSRSRIPYPRDPAAPGPLRHIGLYAYRVDFLDKYVLLSPTPLEQAEKLEQLRVLEHNFAIAVAICHSQSHSIDTPEQYGAFVERWRSRRDES